MVDHLKHRLQYPDDRAVRSVHAFVEPAQSVEVAEEFVGTVDEVNDHFGVQVSFRGCALNGRRQETAAASRAQPVVMIENVVCPAPVFRATSSIWKSS